MSTAEASINEAEQKQIEAESAFKMPEVFAGETVYHWPAGERQNLEGRHLGVVFRVHTRTLELYDPVSRQYFDAVFHVDDPRLKRSVEIREQGAWERPKWNELIAGIIPRLDAIEQRLDKLEQRSNGNNQNRK